MKNKTGRKWWWTLGYALGLSAWVFAVLIASQFTVQTVMSILPGVDLDQPAWAMLASLISSVMEIALILLVPPKLIEAFYKKRQHKDMPQVVNTREALGLKGFLSWIDIGLSPVAYLVATLLGVGLSYLFTIFPWFNLEEAQGKFFAFPVGAGEKIAAFLMLVVIAPIVEEVIFRGWLYGKLRARMGMVASILVTSVLFGVVHGQWSTGVNVFALSVVLCGLREITGTIYAGILTHIIKNAVAFYLLYVLGFG